MGLHATIKAHLVDKMPHAVLQNIPARPSENAPSLCVIDFMWLLFRFSGTTGTHLARFFLRQAFEAFDGGIARVAVLTDDPEKVPMQKCDEQSRRRAKRQKAEKTQSQEVLIANRCETTAATDSGYLTAVEDDEFEEEVTSVFAAKSNRRKDKTDHDRRYSILEAEFSDSTLKRKRDDAPFTVTTLLQHSTTKQCPHTGGVLKCIVRDNGAYTATCGDIVCAACPYEYEKFKPYVINWVTNVYNINNVTNNNFTVLPHLRQAKNTRSDMTQLAPDDEELVQSGKLEQYNREYAFCMYGSSAVIIYTNPDPDEPSETPRSALGGGACVR
ncbi:hypothetical protein CYMTET_36342, partial [Cymbomonas tetramitiformis]